MTFDLKASAALLLAVIFFGTQGPAQVRPNLSGGDPTDTQLIAKKLYERLVSTKISLDDPILAQMTALLEKGDKLGAARIATADPNFYNTTVKTMALEMSNRDETIKVPLNDMVATIIGITRDKLDARSMLTGNFYYRAPSTVGSTLLSVDMRTGFMYANDHYQALDNYRIDLMKNLYRVNSQPLVIGDGTTDVIIGENPDYAGVLTSRNFMVEHATGGTNRRIVEYAFREFLCVPINQWADSGASDARVGRDVNRFPGGDHNKYLTTCKACHSVMDGFRGAFALWTAGSGVVGNSQAIPNADQLPGPKYSRNFKVFPDGYVTVDNSFVNFANRPANASLFGWRGDNTTSGNGAKDFGKLLANSRRFSQCMAKRVYKTVCKKPLPADKEKDLLSTWGDEFEASGYMLKNLFESISVKPECLG
ncbi:MAG: hypothetical protein ACM3MG_12185 [Bacillota bacterium]